MVDGSWSVYEATLLINILLCHLQASFKPIFSLGLAKKKSLHFNPCRALNKPSALLIHREECEGKANQSDT
jgi:hypothetical protein